MAADRPLAERGIVEIKMGRSKFPGKPSKIGNRKRVNLSSCALPEDNDSSKAAKNIYLGLSVFNETFGDNEMVAPGPFYGFSMVEVEEAMAEARLQQKEAELEHKKQGININLWENFQSELFSITSCSGHDSSTDTKVLSVNNIKLSFDGGGSCRNNDLLLDNPDNSENWPSDISSNSIVRSNTTLNVCKRKVISNIARSKKKQIIKLRSQTLKLGKFQSSSSLNKSLQSQAAKKLLDKAKMSNLIESNKNGVLEKKFILPSHSIHSSRAIKPNKRFLEESIGKRRFLRSNFQMCKKAKIADRDITYNNLTKSTRNKQLDEEWNDDIECKDSKKKGLKKEDEVNNVIESKNEENSSNTDIIGKTGRIILREARLQLENSNTSPLEGPFSTPSTSSLSPNSRLSVNPSKSVPGNIVCGVCGIIRFYRFVELAKKFGVYCCESCRKFISKLIKSSSSDKDKKLQCLKGNGLCGTNEIVKSQHFSLTQPTSSSKCQACWLKLCLKKLKIPVKLKRRLLLLLPTYMQIGISLEFCSLSSNITNKFKLGNNNIKDFKWLYENSSSEIKLTGKDISEKPVGWINISDSSSSHKKSLRKRPRYSISENKRKIQCQNGKGKIDSDEKNRQSVVLKGPRVKHVCRSASVALGQPLATFPSDASPTKKQTIEPIIDCNNCDSALTTNISIESQGTLNKSSKEASTNDIKQGNKEKKSTSTKDVSNSKISCPVQQNTVAKAKKKSNAKAENPVSMDFWEIYDPDEICEIGFGLIGSENFSVRALCFLCGSSGHEKLIHCASCCEPYHEFCIDEGQLKPNIDEWKYDWVCPRCTVCFTCGKTSGQQLKCVKCDNSYHIECVDRVGGRLLHSPDRPWVCSVCLRCKSCNGVDVSIFVGNLPLCKACFVLRQKGNYCPLCQRCYEDDDYDSKMMECGQCKCWVHAKCEGLSDEKYQVLSFLPESVEYVCRMCCVMPPAPWWVAVEAELKSGYLGVLKALSKNRKACAMLRWSPRKQCTCRQINFVSRALDFEDPRSARGLLIDSTKAVTEASNTTKEIINVSDQCNYQKIAENKPQPSLITERKTSIEVINHPTESLKLTLKIMKGVEGNSSEKIKETIKAENLKDKSNIKDGVVRIKKSPLNDENGEDPLMNSLESQEDSQTSLCSLNKGSIFNNSVLDIPDKRLLPSPLNPPSDSGIGSTDDELKPNGLTDEEMTSKEEQQSISNRVFDTKSNCDTSLSFLEEKQECFCFLEVDSYNSRSKPFSPNLMSIKKKVTTSEYSSLHQFHQDMERMIATTHSLELMDLYHQTIKDIFPWFDPKFSKVQNSSQKVSGTASHESTPVKTTPTKNALRHECKIPKEKLHGQPLDFFYSDYKVEDCRSCLMCKTVGDGPPRGTGRLLYCGQNEWVHCNCALWSGEVFEEIDGSLQNVHSAISRGRSIRCPECNLKGASIGCCARNCQETYHFNCARNVGCIFMDDKTMYCPLHAKESIGKLVQNEKDFEIRRPVYVELDKRKMKNADSSQIRFAVGALHVNNLGKFNPNLSDQSDAIIPEEFDCTRLFWSCYEPWRIVRYHFKVRLVEKENSEGIDVGINLTIDHSREPELVELKLKQLRYFQEHNTFLDINEKLVEENLKVKRKSSELKLSEELGKGHTQEGTKIILPKTAKKDKKAVKKVIEHFDSKDDENCLSDNQNTADLLPPEIEEAIFKDLPHDILDGISMQDIFMDIKGEPYDGGMKDGAGEDCSESDDIAENSPDKVKKSEYNFAATSEIEFSSESNEGKQEAVEEPYNVSRTAKDVIRSKTDCVTNSLLKKPTALKTYQKSCNINWNYKNDITNNKWKKNSKCHVMVNLFEPQERGNMLQELKFTDGIVTISTGAIGSVKDIKGRLEENKRSIQEEGKENKCLSWQTRLQPRLLQVDGGVDSSSSGSEAGESPQRVIDEQINSKTVAPPQSSPFLHSPLYSLDSPKYSESSQYAPSGDAFSYSSCYYDHSSNNLSNNLPQLDGADDFYGCFSDSEDLSFEMSKLCKRPKRDSPKKYVSFLSESFKIIQCDGGIDSDCEDNDSSKCLNGEALQTLETNPTEEEPVKCDKCHCTYRTKMSYQRHLDRCSTDFILSSSESEMSEEESPRNHFGNASTKQLQNGATELCCFKNPVKSEISAERRDVSNGAPIVTKISSDSVAQTNQKSPGSAENLEVRKEKTVKRTYSRRKQASNAKKSSNTTKVQQVQQILVQQPTPAPALIVQDVGGSGVVPAAFIDSAPTIGYLAAQNPFGKPHLLAAPNGIISGSFQFSAAPESQILGGLCLTPQNIQPNIPGFIIQPRPATGTLISSQPGPVMMSNEQMLVGSTGLFDVIQDPRTGGMFLTSHNQPVFYNMETVVSNMVMQTNQYMSNVLATTYSQTSTQIFQTSEVEQVVNLPSNYIVVGHNPPTTERIITSDELICVQTPQSLISNQNPLQMPNQPVFNSIQAPQTFTSEPKIVSTQIAPVRCFQSICPSVIVNKITNTNSGIINQSMGPVFQKSIAPVSLSPKPAPAVAIKPANKIPVNQPKPKQEPKSIHRSVPMMRPNVMRSPESGFEKAVLTPKIKIQKVQPRSRALVDYINNFTSDIGETTPKNSSQIQPSILETQASPARKISSEPTPSANRLSSRLDDVGITPPKNAVPFTKQNVTPDPSTFIPSHQCLPEVKEVNASKAPVVALPPPVSKETTPTSLPITSSANDLANSGLPNKFSSLMLESIAAKGDLQSVNSEPAGTVPTKVLTNMTNSYFLERESSMSLPVPPLDDPSSPNHEERSKSESPPKNKIKSNDILPLQENSQIACKKSTSKAAPSDATTVLLSSPEEKKKTKKKISPVDQNALASPLVPYGGNHMKDDVTFTLKPEQKKFMLPKKFEENGPKLIFDVVSDDGFRCSSTSMAELWANICDSVQEMRSALKIPPLPLSRKGTEILGMQNHGLQHCLEQLKGVEQCIRYKCKYFLKKQVRKDEDDEVKENLSGCARTEEFTARKEYDMFAWLASKHRQLPKLTESAEETLTSIRRANNLPMAMRYRNLREMAKLYLGVYRSKIHGRGLFCLREIEAGEMVIEYAGEVIRSTLTDKREKYYTDKGIGCYMFRIDDHFVVDATMKGNAARFINHSCEPNCYSKVVDILGKKHIVIFALRRINIMEELTYDYKFPFEDEKISCHCLSKKCRKYLN